MSAHPHVLLVTSSLDVGGAEVYALHLARSLIDRGDRVTMAYGKHYQNPLLERLDQRIGRLELPLRSTVTSRLNHIPNQLACLLPIARFCVAERVSIVHTMLPPVGLPAWIAARTTGRPAVHTPMCASAVATPFSQWLYKSRITGRVVNQYLAPSDYLSYDMNQHMGVPTSMLTTCRFGVDVSQFVPRAPTEVQSAVPEVEAKAWVGVCARLEPDKDVERAIRAFAAVDPSIGAHLAIVGDGSQRAALEALAKTMGIAERTHFLGRRGDVGALLRTFDVGVQTTRGPNLGLVTLEMLASGVPVVIAARNAEEVRMADDTLLGADGGRVSDAAPEALGATIEELLRASEEERVVLRQRARATAERHYDWEGHVDAVRGAYLDVIGVER